MIKSFKHKGLEKFFKKGITSGVDHSHVRKLRLMLAMLNAAQVATDMNAPGLGFHKLKGQRKEIYSVAVSGNWRITFKFKNSNAYIVNYEDYH